MIPRAVLFGNPEQANPRISPDGTHVLYLAPADGVLAVWVRPLDGGEARVVARDPARPIRIGFWSPDGSRILYMQDAGGDENFHVFGVARDGGEAVDLTPFPGVLATPVALEDEHPDEMLVALNERDRRYFDVHRLSFASNALQLDTENPGDVSAWAADHALRVRAAVRARADGGYDVIVRETPEAAWRPLCELAVEDGSPAIAGFTPDGNGLYVLHSGGANARRLLRYDLATHASVEVAADPEYDVAGAFTLRSTRALAAAKFVRARAEWQPLDASVAADFALLRAQLHGDFDIASEDRADARWIVAEQRDDGSPAAWLYERAERRLTKLFDMRPALANYRLAPMTPVSFDARDGLTLHGYLTLPLDVDPRGLPLVLVVHGGPWARDTWGFNPYAQLFADRGYAVLQVNFRGSTGYGKRFVNAGDRQWAGTMRTDLLDAKDWAVRQGIADARRVGIFGGSYGGYAVLAALTFTPDAFACGVDVVGPSNLNTLLASIPPYWTVVRGEFERRMGSDEAELNAMSPLFLADRIGKPLLIAQGANDPRVKIRESDQIVEAMRAKGLPVTYVVFDDEGHGFARPQNNLRFIAAMEAFFAEHLGGRADPAQPDEAIGAYVR